MTSSKGGGSALQKRKKGEHLFKNGCQSQLPPGLTPSKQEEKASFE
jgi:hypothetical protein